jgi:hypothetical protein
MLSAEWKAVADAILSARKQVHREEMTLFGKKVWVYGLTMGEIGEYRRDTRRPDGSVDPSTCDVQFFIRVVRDDNGNRLFDATQCFSLQELSGEDVRPIIRTGEELSGLSAAADAETEKNSRTPARTDAASGS